jgi:tetratricopeptide (TPR) repeat protein
MKSDQGRMFGALFLIAFAIRAAHVLAIANLDANPLFARPIMDAAMHDGWARGILDGTWPGSEPFFRAPLYVYFLAGLYAIFGPEHRLPIQLVHALISALGAGLVGLTAARAFGRSAGWAAGVLYALLWTSIYFAGELLIVTLTTTLNLVVLWLLIRGDDREGPPSAGGLFAIGLALGLSAIARPNILILVPLVVWYLARHRGLGKRGRRWLTLGLGLALPILPVTAHNLLRGHDAVLIASQGGVNFYIGNNPRSDGRTAWVPGTRPTWQGGFEDMQALAVKETGHAMKPAEIDGFYLRKGLSFWWHEPGRALRLYLHKLRLLLAAGERSNNKNVYFWRDRSVILRWPFWLGWAPILCLAVLGYFRRDLTRSRRLVLLGFPVLYAVSILFFFINARYRLPILALLAIPAGAGLVRLVSAWRFRKWPDRRLGLWLAGLLMLVSVIPDRFGFTEDKLELDVFSWHTLGNTFAAAGKLEKARDSYRRALDINHRYPQPYFSWIENSLYTGLGDVLLRLGGPAEAIHVYSAWVRDNPQNVEAQVRLGDLLLQNGQIDEAAAHFEIALRYDPDHYGARLGHTWVLFHNGDYGAALARFQALQRQSGEVSSLFGAGLCLIQLERWSEAEAAFKDILARQPTYWQALGNLAGLYERTGRLEEARRAYEQLLRLQPGDERARTWLQLHPR